MRFAEAGNPTGGRQSLISEDVILTEVQGHKMYVGAQDAVIDSLLAYEKFETDLFKRQIKEGMTVVDLGAHLGYYTLIAAKLVGWRGEVFAFEPEPYNYGLLIRNIATNGYSNVIAVQKAVSNRVGSARLFLSRDNSGDHRMYDSHDGRDSIEIETVTLDKFFKDKSNGIDVIKMDVQGAEMAALQGMGNIIKKNASLKIITEFWPIGLRRFAYSPEGYLNSLIEYGFQLFHINEQKEELEPIDANACMQMCSGERFTNLLCLRKE